MYDQVNMTFLPPLAEDNQPVKRLPPPVKKAPPAWTNRKNAAANPVETKNSNLGEIMETAKYDETEPKIERKRTVGFAKEKSDPQKADQPQGKEREISGILDNFEKQISKQMSNFDAKSSRDKATASPLLENNHSESSSQSSSSIIIAHNDTVQTDNHLSLPRSMDESEANYDTGSLESFKSSMSSERLISRRKSESSYLTDSSSYYTESSDKLKSSRRKISLGKHSNLIDNMSGCADCNNKMQILMRLTDELNNLQHSSRRVSSMYSHDLHELKKKLSLIKEIDKSIHVYVEELNALEYKICNTTKAYVYLDKNRERSAHCNETLTNRTGHPYGSLLDRFIYYTTLPFFYYSEIPKRDWDGLGDTPLLT